MNTEHRMSATEVGQKTHLVRKILFGASLPILARACKKY